MPRMKAQLTLTGWLRSGSQVRGHDRDTSPVRAKPEEVTVLRKTKIPGILKKGQTTKPTYPRSELTEVTRVEALKHTGNIGTQHR